MITVENSYVQFLIKTICMKDDMTTNTFPIDEELQDYYRELDPAKRLHMLLEMREKAKSEASGGAELLTLQEELFHARHPGRRPAASDLYLQCFLDLMYTGQNRAPGKHRGSDSASLKKFMGLFGFPAIRRLGIYLEPVAESFSSPINEDSSAASMEEASKKSYSGNTAVSTSSFVEKKTPVNGLEYSAGTILYWELRNAAARYLATTKESGYADRLLGLIKASKEDKEARACTDIVNIMVGFDVLSSGNADPNVLAAAALLKTALRDEYAAASEEAAARIAHQMLQKNIRI